MVAVLANGSKIPLAAHMSELCCVCNGHGGWNSIICYHAIGTHKIERCENCYSIGYVEPEFKDHIHTWTAIEQAPKFTPAKYCSGCGELWNMSLETYGKFNIKVDRP